MGAGAAAAGIAAGGAIIGGGIQAMGAQSAAKTAASAQNRAADLQMQIYQQNAGNLSPFVATGASALPAFAAYPAQAQAGLDTAFQAAQAQLPRPMTQAELVSTPGYQFNQAEGLKAIQNNAAARGLGVSGVAMKGAANFGTGLANSTYTQQLANQKLIYDTYNQQFSNRYNQYGQGYGQLQGVASLGENAAAQTGTLGNTAAGNAGANIAGAGISQATGTNQAAGALAGASNTAGSAYLNSLLLGNALNQGSGTNVNLGGGGTTQGQNFANYSGPSGISPSVDAALGYQG